MKRRGPGRWRRVMRTPAEPSWLQIDGSWGAESQTSPLAIATFHPPDNRLSKPAAIKMRMRIFRSGRGRFLQLRCAAGGGSRPGGAGRRRERLREREVSSQTRLGSLRSQVRMRDLALQLGRAADAYK